MSSTDKNARCMEIVNANLITTKDMVKFDKFESLYKVDGTKMFISGNIVIDFIRFISTSKRFKLFSIIMGDNFNYLCYDKPYTSNWPDLFKNRSFIAGWTYKRRPVDIKYLRVQAIDYNYMCPVFAWLEIYDEINSMRPGYYYRRFMDPLEKRSEGL